MAGGTLLSFAAMASSDAGGRSGSVFSRLVVLSSSFGGAALLAASAWACQPAAPYMQLNASVVAQYEKRKL